ncbi:MAG: glucokinase [bacterium]|nr:MAG: glucokinase [bacterium]
MRIVSFDLGGTNYKTAFFENNKLIKFDQIKSLSNMPPADTLNYISGQSKIYKADAIGVAVAGAIKNGTILQSPNFIKFDGFSIQKHVEKVTGIRTIAENDANCAAWAAHTIHRKNRLLFITLGTGVGGGIVYDGNLICGGVSAEFGHMTILPSGPICHCGNRGCIEAVIGKWAIRRELENMGYDISIKQFFKNSEQDMRLRKLVLRIGNYLGIAIASASNLFSPELVLLGGKISLSFDYFSAATIRSFSHRVFEVLEKTPIASSSIEHAELIGAKLLAEKMLLNIGK